MTTGDLSAAVVDMLMDRISRRASQLIPARHTFLDGLIVQSGGTSEKLQFNGGPYPGLQAKNNADQTTAVVQFVAANGGALFDISTALGGYFAVRSQIGGGTVLIRANSDQTVDVNRPVVKSPDGSRWELKVDNAGAVTTTKL